MSMSRKFAYSAVAVALTVAAADRAEASFAVAEGWDLLTTEAGVVQPDGSIKGTFFQGVPLEGAPELLGGPVGCKEYQYDFGSGCVNTGLTSAIIKRKEDASVENLGETDEIEIEFEALALRSVDPVNPDGDFATIVFTPFDDFGDTGGSKADITFTNANGGTFTSELNFNFELKIGDVIEGEYDVTLEQLESAWSRIPLDDQVLIEGVNFLLDGTADEDFHSAIVYVPDVGPVLEMPGEDSACRNVSTDHRGENHRHCTRAAVVPLPAGLPLFVGGLAALGIVTRRFAKTA